MKIESFLKRNRVVLEIESFLKCPDKKMRMVGPGGLLPTSDFSKLVQQTSLSARGVGKEFFGAVTNRFPESISAPRENVVLVIRPAAQLTRIAGLHTLAAR